MHRATRLKCGSKNLSSPRADQSDCLSFGFNVKFFAFRTENEDASCRRFKGNLASHSSLVETNKHNEIWSHGEVAELCPRSQRLRHVGQSQPTYDIRFSFSFFFGEVQRKKNLVASHVFETHGKTFPNRMTQKCSDITVRVSQSFVQRGKKFEQSWTKVLC